MKSDKHESTQKQCHDRYFSVFVCHANLFPGLFLFFFGWEGGGSESMGALSIICRFSAEVLRIILGGIGSGPLFRVISAGIEVFPY